MYIKTWAIQSYFTFDSLLVVPFTTGTPDTLTLLYSVLVVTGDDMVSVLAETQSSPFNVPTYGECLIPNDFDGMECNVSNAWNIKFQMEISIKIGRIGIII